MTTIDEELLRIEAELEAAELEATRLNARIAGLRAELAALRSSRDAGLVVKAGPLNGGDSDVRTSTILAVLQDAGGPMRLADIRDELQRVRDQTRFNDNINVVGVTLNLMMSQGRVRRVGRGLYEAA